MAVTNRKAFRFLDLPAELRNQIYKVLANAHGGAVVHLRPNQKHPKWALNDSPPMRYRMSLAQVCQQLRAEFKPIYLRDAHVAVCFDHLPAFIDSFYRPEVAHEHGPRHLAVCIFHFDSCANLFDILPLLKIRLSLADFSCQFFGDFKCVTFDAICTNNRLEKRACVILDAMVAYAQPEWMEQLSKGVFTKIDASNVVKRGYSDFGLEFRDASMTKDRKVKQSLGKMLTGMYVNFCLLTFLEVNDGDGPYIRHEHVGELNCKEE
ncbi:hypothetical protein FB567DRAFT_587881 [Paraphoma chrysanthemicola]|uniref:Uncharacterized protein n=1 Tax=Paraphoma chrysanthemicola TaxID=798071 RepID=A0A8K0RG59_9PLEO|nr:hypothetical protein FB567DRAFT_587881 [Paraphoma chrysanthemicola]